MSLLFRVLCVVAFVVASFRATSNAQVFPTHVVRQGDTLASIAQLYYGDPTRGAMLGEVNHVADDTLLLGLRLVVPVAGYYRVAEGDDWESISTKVLGLPDRAFALVQANDTNVRVRPDAGSDILVPFAFSYRAAQDEPLQSIATRFLDDSRTSVRLLRRYNNLSTSKVKAGTRILVPVTELALSAEAQTKLEQDILRQSNGETARKVQQVAVEKIPALRTFVGSGQYARAAALGNELLCGGRLSDSQSVAVHQALAIAYVALGQHDAAVESFVKALRKLPDLELDSVTTSPKVLAALSAARERIHAAGSQP
ncbi:MAG: LysM domain-containing protein [Polyangiales bacterium]